MNCFNLWMATIALASSPYQGFGQTKQGIPFTVPFQPANDWMMVPVTWSQAGDTVTHTTRALRDQYFDTLIGFPTPLTSTNAQTRQFSEGARFGPQKEIPDFPNRAIAIASFMSSKPILSASGKSIYTEISLLSNNSFKNDSLPHPVSQTITLIVPGGTIKNNTGEVISYLTGPKEFFLKPGRIYLLVMAYEITGDFYMLSKAWDLTSGKAERNFGTPASSSLIGQSNSQVMATINQLGVY